MDAEDEPSLLILLPRSSRLDRTAEKEPGSGRVEVTRACDLDHMVNLRRRQTYCSWLAVTALWSLLLLAIVTWTGLQRTSHTCRFCYRGGAADPRPEKLHSAVVTRTTHNHHYDFNFVSNGSLNWKFIEVCSCVQ
eukprot:356776-Chlamydomonas_euryale.AAC.2